MLKKIRKAHNSGFVCISCMTTVSCGSQERPFAQFLLRELLFCTCPAWAVGSALCYVASWDCPTSTNEPKDVRSLCLPGVNAFQTSTTPPSKGIQNLPASSLPPSYTCPSSAWSLYPQRESVTLKSDRAPFLLRTLLQFHLTQGNLRALTVDHKVPRDLPLSPLCFAPSPLPQSPSQQQRPPSHSFGVPELLYCCSLC